MSIFRKDSPEGFTTPTKLPVSPTDAERWQRANRSWWESHPMRYDWGSRNPFEPFSKEFYAEVDRQFYASTRNFMPWKAIPFDPLIDFPSLLDKDVLEIGVGAGSHAQLLAEHSRSYTGIDLTEHAVELTSRRLETFGLRGRIQRMDAENMEFDDASFDVVWSWGVIHHSANTRRILEEMHRVLRPSGRTTVMVYHRNWWNYYVGAGMCQGILKGDLFRKRSLHEIMQNRWDGALARFYTTDEWQKMASDLFSIDDILIFGQKSEVFPLNIDWLRRRVLRLTPTALSRFFTNRCRLGSFLVAKMTRRD